MNCLHSQWHARMKRALDLSGKSPATQEAYLRSVRQLADYLKKDPEEVEEQELDRYLLYRRNESRWKLFCILHAEDQRPLLPVVLTQQEVDRILSCVKTFHNYAFLSLVYACGLRLGEALALTTDDIDARAMLVHVSAGKGRKDRTVPLPEDTLKLLRRYWRTHRHPTLLFPALGSEGNDLDESRKRPGRRLPHYQLSHRGGRPCPLSLKSFAPPAPPIVPPAVRRSLLAIARSSTPSPTAAPRRLAR